MNTTHHRNVLSKLPVMTIRTRLTLWYSSLLATVIVVFGISLFSVLNWAWRSQVHDNMLFIAQQTALNIVVDNQTGNLEVQTPEVVDLITYPYLIQVRQANGQLVQASSSPIRYTDPFDREMLKTTETVTRDIYVGQTHAYVMTVPIFSPSGS